MKTRIIVVAGALALLATLPAEAGSNKLSGSLKAAKGSAGAGSISLTVKTTAKGIARSVKSVKVTVAAKCKDVGGEQEVALPGKSFSRTLKGGPLNRQDRSNSFTLREGAPATFTVYGKVNRAGTAVTKGSVGVSERVGDVICEGVANFKAKR